MPQSRKRRHNSIGTRPLVCGKPVHTKSHLICLLPPGLHNVHCSFAIDSEGFIVIAYRKEGGETVWLSIPDPKASPEE